VPAVHGLVVSPKLLGIFLGIEHLMKSFKVLYCLSCPGVLLASELSGVGYDDV